MVSICFYFQVHQPFRVKRYSVFDIGKGEDYFSDTSDTDLNNAKIARKVAEKCYLPANRTMLEMIKQHPEFKISYSISGVALEQFEKFCPDVLESFKELVATGNVEMLSETYYHSLAYLYDKEEFKEQVAMHRRKIKELFGVTPTVFRNTELIFNNELARYVEEMGYKGILAEGADRVLGWRSPNFVYKSVHADSIKVLLKNFRLSDDIAFRFSEKSWKDWPLTVPKFAQWVNAVNGNGNVINLFMDYETFGEHQWADTGIFEFLKALPGEILKHPDNDFKTPSEVIDSYNDVGRIDVHSFMSWADVERDLSAWLGNPMQHSSIDFAYALKNKIMKTKDVKLLDAWRKLQTSDHFYYMCTKWFADGDVHKYFNPYDSPYEAFISYMNALHDLNIVADRKLLEGEKQNIYNVN